MKKYTPPLLGILLLCSVLAGCDQPSVAESQYKADLAKHPAKYAAEAAVKDAIERDAHASGNVWYEVKLEKFGGECRSVGQSARVDVDSYHSGAVLSVAEQDGGHYWLRYSLSGPFYQKIYTTSVEWCDRTIAANSGR